MSHLLFDIFLPTCTSKNRIKIVKLDSDKNKLLISPRCYPIDVEAVYTVPDK